MKVTQVMLEAAMKKAVESGLIHGQGVDPETYLKTWDAMEQVLQVALDLA